MKNRTTSSKAAMSKAGLSKAGLSKTTAMSRTATLSRPALTDSTRSTMKLLAMDDDDDDDEDEDVKKFMDLDDFIEFGCSKFVCPYKISVKKEMIKDEPIIAKSLKPESSKHKKITPQHPKLITSDNTDKLEETAAKEVQTDENTLVISALYDNSNRLVELLLQELPDIPRVLMQIMGLFMPMFPSLTRMIIKKCRMDKYTIYELGKVLQFTSITDICLDGSSFPEANYAILLKTSRIQSLSLARCNINDAVCETIASELQFLQSAEVHLVTLNLSSNRITDEGAKHLGLALRTNRHLRYLNLSNNRITDEGADHIFRVLMLFPLSSEEIKAKQLRYMTYLRAKNEILKKYLVEFQKKVLESPSLTPTNSSKKTKQRESIYKPPSKLQIGRSSKAHPFDDLAYIKAENMACELIGPFIDPFHNTFLKVIDGFTYCAGNMVLCYLNLGYNNMSLMGVKKLLEVVKYQSKKKKLSQLGLLKVVIEGNNLPISSCLEMDLLYDYLNQNVVNFTPKYKVITDPKTGKIHSRARSSRTSVLPETQLNKS